eukprot:8650665-Heterocapsa_arctica.AAC.2
MLSWGWLTNGLEGSSEAVWQDHKEVRLGMKGAHETICDLWLPQEELRTGSGGKVPNTQEQWELNHEEKNGVRIGEAQNSGHDSAAAEQEKTWTGLTANITAWKSSGLAWAVHEKDDFILLQETRLARKQVRRAKGAATKQGYDAVFAPAM